MDQLLIVLAFVAQNTKSFFNLGLTGIAVGVNIRVNSVLFDCPGMGYKPYGYMFLFAPCVILLFVNMIVVSFHPRRLLHAVTRQNKEMSKFGIFRNVVNPSISSVLAGPFAWLIVSLAQADYLVCATVGPGPEKRVNLTITEAKDLMIRIEESKAQSQIAAWALLITAALWTCIVIALQDHKEGNYIIII